MQPRHVRAFGLGAIAAAFVAAAVVLLAPSHRLVPDRRLPAVGRLPETARAALSAQMKSHARGMMELVSTATVLDYEGVGAGVQRLLAEPRVARPLTGDASELNAQLPARFFELQDQLRTNLQSVAQAAGARDPEALADSFAAATKTCIRCHDAYLTGR
jgi:cytochrome c556